MAKPSKAKGITLISLIITIIILLILAGVSISLLTGNTNVADKARNAGAKWNVAVQNEANTLQNIFDQVEDEGAIGIKARQISAEDKISYYGKTVEYTATCDSNVGWKIFHIDNNNIYIIADTYVTPDITHLPDFGTLLTNGNMEKTARWSAFTGYDNGLEGLGANLKTGGYIGQFLSQTRSTINNNEKAVAHMLDTSKWTPKYQSTTNDYAEYAIGGPTIEMFRDSYNLTHSGVNIVVNAYEVGYTVISDTNTSGDVHWINGLDGNDELYMLPQSAGANAYWLASPSNGNPDRTENVWANNIGDGGVGDGLYDNTDYRFSSYSLSKL